MWENVAMSRLTVALVCCGWLMVAASALAADAPTKIDYSRQVRPILSGRCFQCHGPDAEARQADLRLDEQVAATGELPSGARAIAPGDLSASALLDRVTTADPDQAMPPAGVGKRLTDVEVSILKQWIAEGADYTRHWAYVAPVRQPLPAVSQPAWPKNPIDYFLLARLDREGLKPAAEADRPTLLRRVALDLTGLPPTVEEVERFVADLRPDAYERAVDDLLAQQSYGERFAAMWLDLGRYGDSQGYIHDPPRTIWRWRDAVIDALNANLPYDRLTIELLAGDLLPEPTTEQVIATGFHRNTTNNTEGGAIPEEYRHASVVDRVNTTMQVWMGTTIGCAQCHTHKYDPITQHEYYQVFAIFNGTTDANSEEPSREVPRVGLGDQFTSARAALEAARAQLDAETKRINAELPAWIESVDRGTLPKEVADLLAVAVEQRSKEQNDKLAAHHRSLSAAWKTADDLVKQRQAEFEAVSTTTLVMNEGPARTTHVALRGDYKSLGDAVQPGVPAAFHAFPADAKRDRLGLARWLVDPANPLAARVAVNRLWQEVFGIGIVETAEDFGNQGEPPIHPELLDWLATEYLRLGWDTKAILKLMVTSAAYQQASHTSTELAARDPFNRLLARGPRVRLSAEAVRDQALAASGLLSRKMHGPPVHPPQPINGLAAAFGSSTDWETSAGEDRYRRALYTRWRRNLPYASMVTFDAPERSVCSIRRTRSNTPLQALVTMNDPVFVEAAQALARCTVRDGGANVAARAQFAFRRVLLRDPEKAELDRLVALFEQAKTNLAADATAALALATKPLGDVPPGMDAVELSAWTVVGNVLLNLDETLAKP
jgi:mono/diheme cytochrome c family protein